MDIKPHLEKLDAGVVEVHDETEQELLLDGAMGDGDNMLASIRGLALGLRMTVELGLGDYPRTTKLTDGQILRVARNIADQRRPGESPLRQATRDHMVNRMTTWAAG